MTSMTPFCHVILFLFASGCSALTKNVLDKSRNFLIAPKHSNNWAVLVCSSRFWFNYRHVANVLAFYKSVKEFGIPDSNIILMLADNIPCNARNPFPGTIYHSAYEHTNIFNEDVEVDYRGFEVTAENFVRLLTGRVSHTTPRNKRLLSDHRSNVLIYLTGHGGDTFLKFQDAEELTNVDIAHAIESMNQHRRYNEIFLIADTCQSESLYTKIYSPRVLATSSSLVGEDSLSHHVDRSVGVYIIDRYAHYIYQFLDGELKRNPNATLAEFVRACDKSKCISTVGVRTDLYPKRIEQVRTMDFFGSKPRIRSLAPIIFSFNWDSLD